MKALIVRFRFLLLALVLLFVFPGLIAARPMQAEPPDLTDLTAVLLWLAGAGGPYFVGWVLALVVENVPAWHKLSPGIKTLIPLIFSPLVSVLATLALQQTATLEQISPWYSIVAGSILGYIGSQRAYMVAKQAGYGSKAKYG